MTLATELAQRAAQGITTAWQPRRFTLSNPAQQAELTTLLQTNAVRTVHDTLTEQLCDWLRAQHPARRWTATDLHAEGARVRGSCSVMEYGTWVFYPWSGVLTHILPEMEFRYLRTVRNRFKITPAEQATLAQATIAIAGLSVGLAAALTLALEGIGCHYRLADLDSLSLSNLNRLNTGLSDLGTNKAVIAARRLAELDPYLTIDVFPEGVTPANLASFLGEPTTLLIEECDDLAMKVRLRREARARRIPVLMDTSDRGLLDVERFDREPTRPLLHGLFGTLSPEDVGGLSPVDKIPLGLQMLQAEQTSVRLRASLPEVGRTIETWPQLASAVALGGALIADPARRILLGQLQTSGRFYVDLEALVNETTAMPVVPLAGCTPPVVQQPELPERPPPGSGTPTHDEIRYLIAHAILAPSGGNSQPWQFVWADGTLTGYIVPERTNQFFDCNARSSYVALGAALENTLLAAAALGWQGTLVHRTKPHEAWRLAFAPAAPHHDPLLPMLPLRVTNRRVGIRTELTAAERQALHAAVVHHNGQLCLIEDASKLEDLGKLMGQCDRAALLVPAGHRAIFSELRFTAEAVRQTRDGLDLDALEVNAAERAALAVLADARVAAQLRAIDGGYALTEMAKRAIAGCMAIGLVRVRGHERSALVQGGRALQRLWLTATQLGLGIHPWTSLPYLSHRLDVGATADFTTEELSWFAHLRDAYRAILPLATTDEDILLFRITRAEPPTARSLRRPLADVLTIAANH